MNETLRDASFIRRPRILINMCTLCMRNALNSLANEEHTTFIVTKHYHLTERLS